MQFLKKLFGSQNTDEGHPTGRPLPPIEKFRAAGDVESLIKACSNSEVCDEAIDALSKIGEPAVWRLVQALKAENELVRQSAVKALVKIGEPAVLGLINGLTSGYPAADGLAADALNQLGDIAVDRLIQGLTNKDFGIRQNSAFGLEKLKSKKAVEPLIAMLQGPDSSGNEHLFAARALGSIGEAQAVGPLIAALNDEKMAVRNKAAEALGKIKSADAVEALIETLRSPDNSADVRSSAALALGELQDARAVEPLIAWLQSPDIGANRFMVIVALGKINDLRAIEPIRAVFNTDPNPLVKTAAEKVLEKLSQHQDRTSVDIPNDRYYGLSITGGNSIQYTGPTQKMDLDGNAIPDFIAQLSKKVSAPHLVIVPQMGLVIVVKTYDDFLAFGFNSPMEKQAAADFLKSLFESGRKITLVEKYGAIELL